MDKLTGKTISHFRIGDKIGAGGMGIVYKAVDIRLGRTVAIKFFTPGIIPDSDAKKRFFQEARAASALDHPNICTIFEIDDTEEGNPFISMAYYRGKSLKYLLDERKLSINESENIAVQIAGGISEAHKNGIIHRDIKPANILIDKSGQVKIIDFGIAQMPASTEVSRTNSIMGTIAYMSPEQLKGDPLDFSADIWSFGIVLFEMLAGRLPYSNENEQAIIYSVFNEDIPGISSFRKDVPDKLAELIKKCLAKKTTERYQNAVFLVNDLYRISGAGKVAAKTNISEVIKNLFRSSLLIKTMRIWISLFLILLVSGSNLIAASGTLSAPPLAVIRFKNLTGNAEQNFHKILSIYGQADEIKPSRSHAQKYLANLQQKIAVK